jgi:prepilin-type N-terminal cleavage/methylation domain-containing protein
MPMHAPRNPGRMRMRNLTLIGRDQRGFALVEVLVSAVLLLMVSAGVYTAFAAGTRSTAQERHRARANNLAEQELERVRSLRIADLTTLNRTSYMLEDGSSASSCPATSTQTCYTITSQSQFLTETATTSTCASGTGSRDYLQLTVSVSWTGMGPLHPVTATTIVSPPSGSLVPNSGSLLVAVDDSNSNGIPGVTLTGSGAGSFTGTTGPTGCVLWRNLPAGTYTMTASGAASGMVDPDGNAPAPQTVSIVDTATANVNLQYDRPGGLTVAFTTQNYSGTVVNSTADGISAFNTGMSQWKTFSAANSSSITTPQVLFPFASPSAYAVYAGQCPSNNPDPTGAGVNPLGFANVVVPPAGTGLTPDNVVQLPSLDMTVRTGSSSLLPGSVVNSADVHVTDMNCTASSPLTRVLATNASGQLADTPTGVTDPGLPYSTNYKVCADANISGTQRMNYVRTTALGSPIEQVGVTDPAAGTVKTVYLTGPGATSGSGAQCSP